MFFNRTNFGFSEFVSNSIQNNSGSILISDRSRQLTLVKSIRPDINHKTFKALAQNKNKTDKIIHVNSINQIHSSFKKLLYKFNGVSTSNLQIYINWFILDTTIKELSHDHFYDLIFK